MLKQLSLIVVAAALPLCPAVAASSASASLDPYLVRLVDLNRQDGITPWIELAGGSYGSYVAVSVLDPSIGGSSQTRWTLVPWGPISTSAQLGLSQAQAAMAGDVFAAAGTLSASGAALGSSWPGNASSFSASAASPASYTAFTLSPYTLALFSGVASLSARTTVGFDPITGGAEFADASVQLSVTGPGPGGGGSQWSSDGRYVNASWTMDYDPTTGDWTYRGMNASLADQWLSVSFTNNTASELSGNLQVMAGAGGSSGVAPVPELETWALMLAGLGAVGWVARRRQR
jgi:hypothetical protein